MTTESTSAPAWLATVLLAQDDTEESVMGSDWHQEAIFEAHGPLLSHAEAHHTAASAVPWYVSSQVTVIVPLPRRVRPWQPKPDLFVVVGLPPGHRTSYDTRREGPMPQFVLEVASESTWRDDVAEKRDLYALAGVQEYLVFDPTGTFLAERLRGWRVGQDGWQGWPPAVQPDGQVAWHSAVLGLSVRAEGPLLRFAHPVLGPLPLRREVALRLRDAEQAHESERKAREAAEQALADLRRQLHQNGSQ